MTTRTRVAAIGSLLLLASAAWLGRDLSARQSVRGTARSDATRPDSAHPGQTATRLPDGRWLFVGGQGTEATASLWDPQTNATRATRGAVQAPRAWHSATILADGTVLLVGGRNGSTLADIPEVFDPATETFTALGLRGAMPRASHTATLLTDGRVLIAGGSNGGPTALGSEVWDVQSQTAQPVAARVDRTGHTATLQADGRVRITGGTALDGSRGTDALVIDADRGSVEAVRPSGADQRLAPAVAGSIPASGSTEVSLDAHVAIRFSEPMTEESLAAERLVLRGPDGAVTTRVIVAEDGRLAFIWPADRFEASTTYSLHVDGATTLDGIPITPTTIAFTTISTSRTDAVDTEAWTPDLQDPQNGWRTNRPQSPWESLPPLMAEPGITAISGRVLTLDGRPLPDVALSLEEQKAYTDRTGRFLLIASGTDNGEHTLEIDATTANRGQRKYGFYESRITVKADTTNVVPFTIWSPRLDVVHEVTIPSPTTTETIVSTPTMPGLELHLPAGTTIIGEDGQVVRKLTMTPIPLDRTPFPLPTDAMFSMFFTIQPGGAYIKTSGPNWGGWLVYPNRTAIAPGTKVQFFNYDPDDKGWYVYGLGTVMSTKVIPEARTRIYAFTGASFNSGPTPPDGGQTPDGPSIGEPVDPATGAFIMKKTDLYLPDVMPIALTRTYNSMDSQSRGFGFGMTHAYGLFQYTTNQYNDGDLILPDGGRIHYLRISADGLPWNQTVMENQSAPTVFYKSRLFFDGNAWEYALKNGTVLVMGHQAPLQSIRDKYGNTVRLTWSSTNAFGAGYGNLVRITSPNGRWIELTYDSAAPVNHVTQAKDNIGRTVSYTYDASGNLSTVTDPAGYVMTYTYDTSHRMLTITDGRNITYLTNTYANGRVATQTLADANATYSFDYTVDGSGSITQTDVTNPRAYVERFAFNSDHYATSTTEAYGTSLARTTTYTRQTGSNFPTAIVDGLGRETDYTYDTSGHVLSATRLAGTANAVTTSYTYEPKFFKLATVTDPLNHTWTMTYDAVSHLTGLTDPLSHHTSVVMNALGQVTSVTDPLSHQWQFGYTGGDLTSTTDPLNRITSRFVDAAGRMLTSTDPLGRTTRMAIDNLNRPTTTTDPLGGQTSFAYDANSNLTSLTDALTHATTYTYDAFDRVATRTDPLQHAESFAYDFNDNLTQSTDRKSQVTSRQYDALDRLRQVTFDDSSTITYTYDAGDRVTQIADSANGTITRTFDDLNRLTEETTPEGTVDYTYDADGRRASMTVAGQAAVTYTYDDAHRLTGITQDTATVSITYDNANRRSTLTFPNGIVATYAYDAASQLTSLAYTLGLTSLGDLTYTYDAAGQRTSVNGSWARTGIPASVASATYDAANRIVSWDGTSISYDPNGNLVSDGLSSYSWNARNQLSGLAGGTSAGFQYDGLSRRRGKTIAGTTTNFLYDGVNLVQEFSGSTPTANVLTGSIDETFTRTDGSGTSTFLTDALRSTLELADGSGTLQTHYTYEPFGATTTSGTASTNAAQFTGRENDGTGVYFYRARYYDPTIGAFISEDPARADATMSRYLYTKDDPTDLIDPSGLDVTIWVYAGIPPNPAGHVAISINDGAPFGFGPAAGFGLLGSVPGEVEIVPRSRMPEYRYTIPTSPEQDAAIWNYILERYRDPGRYTAVGRNCVRFVEEALGAGGFEAPTTALPKDLVPSLSHRPF